MRRPSSPQVVTIHALKLAISPGWSEDAAAEHLLQLVGGNELPLRTALARLEWMLLERPSHAVERACRSLRAGIERMSQHALEAS